MELNVAITLTFLALGVGVIGYKALKTYLMSNEKISLRAEKVEMESKILTQKNEIEKLENSVVNYKYKNGRLRREYDLDFEDFDTEEEEDEGKLSDLVKYIYPKMPPSLKKIIDNEELQGVVMKRFAENPEKTMGLLERFLPKKQEGSTNKEEVAFTGV